MIAQFTSTPSPLATLLRGALIRCVTSYEEQHDVTVLMRQDGHTLTLQLLGHNAPVAVKAEPMPGERFANDGEGDFVFEIDEL